MWGTGNGRGPWRKLLGMMAPEVSLRGHKGKGTGECQQVGNRKKENRPINHINFLSEASNESHNVIFANLSRSLIVKRNTIHNLETTLLSPFFCPSLCLTPTAERMKTTCKDCHSTTDLFRAGAYLSMPLSSVTYFLCSPCQSFSAFPHTSSSSSHSLAPFISSCAHLPCMLHQLMPPIYSKMMLPRASLSFCAKKNLSEIVLSSPHEIYHLI